MTNMPHSDLSSIDLYNKGAEVQTINHNAAEAPKMGTLRGGSSGALVKGEVYGKCHRLSLARYKGISTPKSPDSQYWFDAGYANEEAWAKKLDLFVSANPDYTIKSEEECPITWETSNGTKVTGRPDFVIFKDSKPVLGLELKVVCTVGSAISRWCDNTPSVDNLIQTAHYSLKMGCPYNLVYSFRSRGYPHYYVQKKYKDTGLLSKKGEINPFICEFKVGFDNDIVYYIDRFGKRTNTKITGQSISDYYELITDMEDKKDLYTRVASKDLVGKQLPWNNCGNCAFKSACDKAEDDYDQWFDHIRQIELEGK